MSGEVNGLKLAFMAVISFLLIDVGLTGRLGSLLAAIIDPASLQEGNTFGGNAATHGTASPAGEGQKLPTTGVLTPIQIGKYAKQAGFIGNNLVIAIAVSLAESGGNIEASHTNSDGSVDRGLWQINSIHRQFTPSRLFEPAYNASAAYTISGGFNWNPWVTYTTGAYRSHMSTAAQAAKGL